MKINNKTAMMIAFIVLIILIVLTIFFKVNPKTIEEPVVQTSSLNSQKLVVTTDGDESERTLDFIRNFVFSAPNNVTEPQFGLTVTGGCKFATETGEIEFLPIDDGTFYTLQLTPNWDPKMDNAKVTANYESTFTNVEYIEAENKVVIYFSGTFTFSDGTNTFTHDVNENFDIKLDDYLN